MSKMSRPGTTPDGQGTPSLTDAATFKMWTTGGHNWHVHARHPVTKAWTASHGHYSEVAAMVEGNRYCDQLDAEYERMAAHV